jgi:LPXTG-motif cell wall-anchored protein
VSNEYAYLVAGNLDAAEGTAYSITVTAAAAAGYEFPPAAQTTWTFTGTVSCVIVDQRPATSTTTTTTTTTTTVTPSEPDLQLPRTGASSTSILLAYASILTLSGGLLLLVRRTARRPAA